jgi:xanthine/CO dehydrogenase XdhC/CoxF family maturation factor
VRCPIGVTRDSKDPAAIALSTATELVGVLAALPAASGAEAHR